jgi:hypothetical protein
VITIQHDLAGGSKMKRWVALRLVVIATLALLPMSAYAKPKKKTYNNSADQVFKAALRTARERHVVTYVDEKTLMFTFETGRSVMSYGFVANASVEAEGEEKATLIINVQNKQGVSWGAGDRMADKFYEQVAEELAGDTQQKSAVKAPERAISVPEPKAVPPEPSMTKPADVGSSPTAVNSAVNIGAKGRILLTSAPDGADIYVDGTFVGNAPATLRLSEGKHTVKVSQQGYKDWAKEVSVFADSEVSLKATLGNAGMSPDSGRERPADTPGVGGQGSLGAWSGEMPRTRHDGITISGITRGGPADQAGIQVGDVILAIGGRYVFTVEELNEEVHRQAPGIKVALRYRRYATIYDTYVVMGAEKNSGQK